MDIDPDPRNEYPEHALQGQECDIVLRRGTKVWYWGHEGTTSYGVVMRTNRRSDGVTSIVVRPLDRKLEPVKIP